MTGCVGEYISGEEPTFQTLSLPSLRSRLSMTDGSGVFSTFFGLQSVSHRSLILVGDKTKLTGTWYSHHNAHDRISRTFWTFP